MHFSIGHSRGLDENICILVRIGYLYCSEKQSLIDFFLALLLVRQLSWLIVVWHTSLGPVSLHGLFSKSVNFDRQINIYFVFI